MPFFSNNPKNIDIEELVKQCLREYADKNKFSVTDYQNNRSYIAIPYDQDYLDTMSKALVKNVFGALFGLLASNKGNSISGKNDYNDILERIDKTTYEGLTFKSKTDNKRYYSILEIWKAQERISNSLNNVLSEISRLAQAQETTLRENSLTIQKQHDSLLRYDNDLLYKSKNHLINEIIGIADQLKQIADDQKIKSDFSKLMEDVEALEEWVNGTLQTESVRKYEFAKQDPKKFDPKYQEMVETRYTTKIEEDGTYKTILPGYFWTIPMVSSNATQSVDNSPKSFEFILRHEQVVRMNFRQDHNNLDKYQQRDADEKGVVQVKAQNSQIATYNSGSMSNSCNPILEENTQGNKPLTEEKYESYGQRTIDFSKDSSVENILNGQNMINEDQNNAHRNTRDSSNGVKKDSKRKSK